MIKWKHKSLDTIIETESILGGKWEKVTNRTIKNETIEAEQTISNEEQKNMSVSSEQTVSDTEEQTGNADIDSINKKDIIQELEAMGIEHNPRDKKQVLYDLMMSQGE